MIYIHCLLELTAANLSASRWLDCCNPQSLLQRCVVSVAFREGIVAFFLCFECFVEHFTKRSEKPWSGEHYTTLQVWLCFAAHKTRTAPLQYIATVCVCVCVCKYASMSALNANPNICTIIYVIGCCTTRELFSSDNNCNLIKISLHVWFMSVHLWDIFNDLLCILWILTNEWVFAVIFIMASKKA